MVGAGVLVVYVLAGMMMYPSVTMRAQGWMCNAEDGEMDEVSRRFCDAEIRYRSTCGPNLC